MNRRADGVPVDVLGQVIDIQAMGLALVEQPEPVRDENCSRPHPAADFQFPGLAARPGDHTHFLSVIKSLFLCIRRVYGNGAGAFALVPFRIPHQSVGIGFHVPAGI